MATWWHELSPLVVIKGKNATELISEGADALTSLQQSTLTSMTRAVGSGAVSHLVPSPAAIPTLSPLWRGWLFPDHPCAATPESRRTAS